MTVNSEMASKRSKKVIFKSKSLFFLLGVLFLAIIHGVSAQSGTNNTKSANVTVQITAVTMIDMNPSTLSYTASPGQACGRDITGGTCNETGSNYFAIQVENIGSWNITQVWFNVSQPSQNPFAVGSNLYVDPGNFIALTTNESTDDFYFVDKKEYKAVRTIVYLKDPSGTMPANLTKYNYGRLHNASSEYFYMIENTSTGAVCNATQISYIRIGVNPHTTTQVGSTDFSTGPSVNYIQINLTTRQGGGGQFFAVGNITAGPLSGYAVAVENTTCVVRFAKWNKDFPFDVGSANYSFNGVLTPGDSLAKKIAVLVDNGIYTGSKTGQLTAIAIGAA